MTDEKVCVERSKSHVATVILNRPDYLNTLDSEMAELLYESLLELDKDRDVRVVLLKGNGKAFCAGIDVNELTDKTAMEYRAWVKKMIRPLPVISKMIKPVIAQVQGVAAANGLGLVAAADLAIAAENARMGLTAINVGLNCIGPVIPVIRCIGRKRALELLMGGELIKAPTAVEMGLINRVVPEKDLDQEALRWAEDLARKSPIALQIAKSAFYAAEDMSYEQQFDFMNETFAHLCTTDDAKEGVQAFFEKRKPDWKEK